MIDYETCAEVSRNDPNWGGAIARLRDDDCRCSRHHRDVITCGRGHWHCMDCGGWKPQGWEPTSPP